MKSTFVHVFDAYISHTLCIAFCISETKISVAEPLFSHAKNSSYPHQNNSSFTRKTVSMASSSNARKRMKSLGRGPRYVDNTDHLEAWFAWETKEDSQKSIDAYLTTYSRKIVNIPKFVRLEWLEE